MSDRSIIEAIQRISGTQLTDTVRAFDGTVESVNEPERTCSVVVVAGQSAVTIPDVRLMAAIDDGVLIIPEIDSTVTVITSTYGDPYVSTFSEVARIIFMGGDLGGLVKLLPLLKSLNSLENDINTLKSVFSSWVPLAGDGGLALKTAATAWISNSVAVTDRTDIENTNIKQG